MNARGTGRRVGHNRMHEFRGHDARTWTGCLDCGSYWDAKGNLVVVGAEVCTPTQSAALATKQGEE